MKILRNVFSSARDGRSAQQRIGKRILAAHAGTRFARDHGLTASMTLAEFRRAVPLQTYASLESYLAAVRDGEQDVLSDESPTMFATTSGTTGTPKFIPVTPTWADELARLDRRWIRSASTDHPGSFASGIMMIVGAAVEGRTARGIPFGAMSGVLYQRLLRAHPSAFVVPYDVAEADEAELRYFLALRFALASDVSSIGTANPTTLLRLAEVAALSSERLIRAIHDGALGVERMSMSADAMSSLERRCSPNPRRAAELTAMIERRGRLRPADAWPGLRFIGCWLGGSAGEHATLLDESYGAVARRDLGLMASEGRFSLPTADGTPAGTLTVDSNLYEFLSEAGDDPDDCRWAHELEAGKEYELVVTARNGLWRYRMNDVVRVTAMRNDTPEIAFIRKGRDILNIMGEKVHIDHLRSAMRELEAVIDAKVAYYRCIPNVTAFRHDILIEFRRPPSEFSSALSRIVDAVLQRENCEYRSKRLSGRLRHPVVLVMRPGWGDEQMRRDFTGGKRVEQYKWSVVESHFETWHHCWIQEGDGLERI